MKNAIIWKMFDIIVLRKIQIIIQKNFHLFILKFCSFQFEQHSCGMIKHKVKIKELMKFFLLLSNSLNMFHKSKKT